MRAMARNPDASGPTMMPTMPSDNKPIKDFSIYSVPQLIELRDRQSHLLAHKKRIASLPDKGDRIRAFHSRVLAELVTRDAINDASQLFSALNIAATGKSLTTQMEWHGKNVTSDTVVVEDDDDAATGDERNPLKLLAQSRQTTKVVTVEPPIESLITAADRQAIEEFANEKTADELEPHALYMCSIDDRHPVKRDKFLPHKTVISPTKNTSSAPAPAKPRPAGVKQLWENTSATPPALRNATVVALSLQDSIDIQRQQQDALRKLDLQHAAERLAARDKLAAKLQQETYNPTESTAGSLFASYRNTTATSSDDDDDEDDDPDNNEGDDEHSGEEDK